MKSYKEVSESVLKRRDEYLKEQKHKRAIIIKTTSSVLGTAAAACIGLAIYNNTTIQDIKPDPDDNPYNVTEQTATKTTTAKTITTSTDTTVESSEITTSVDETTIEITTEKTSNTKNTTIHTTASSQSKTETKPTTTIKTTQTNPTTKTETTTTDESSASGSYYTTDTETSPTETATTTTKSRPSGTYHTTSTTTRAYTTTKEIFTTSWLHSGNTTTRAYTTTKTHTTTQAYTTTTVPFWTFPTGTYTTDTYYTTTTATTTINKKVYVDFYPEVTYYKIYQNEPFDMNDISLRAVAYYEYNGHSYVDESINYIFSVGSGKHSDSYTISCNNTIDTNVPGMYILRFELIPDIEEELTLYESYSDAFPNGTYKWDTISSHYDIFVDVIDQQLPVTTQLSTTTTAIQPYFYKPHNTKTTAIK